MLKHIESGSTYTTVLDISYNHNCCVSVVCANDLCYYSSNFYWIWFLNLIPLLKKVNYRYLMHYLYDIMYLLNILLFADRKLCVKARLTGALQVTMNMVKNNTTFFKVLQPALQVLKLYSANCKSVLLQTVGTYLTKMFSLVNMFMVTINLFTVQSCGMKLTVI